MPDAVAHLRLRLQLVRKACQEIGQAPPRPAGLRAAVGGIAVAVMRRLMFWYAPAVREAIGGLAGVVDDALGDLGAHIADLESHIQQAQSMLERQSREAALREQERAQIERQLQERIDEHARILELERATTISIEGDLREQTETLEELERRLGESGERLQFVRREVIENTQRLARLPAQAAGPDAAPLRASPEENPAGWDALEAALESEIRGTRGEAMERWKPYLPLMPREGPVLDVGCGRGEWLELLRQEGIAARGVERNLLMVAECRERSLDVEQSDAFDYLARTPDGSEGAVTVLRLVERLSLRTLARLVDEVARVLRPGGTALFEAPNPDNVLEAGWRHPIPSGILRCLLEARGLEPAEVLFLNPAGEDERVPEEGEGAVTRRFNRFFYGPRDYAVVCRKAPSSWDRAGG